MTVKPDHDDDALTAQDDGNALLLGMVRDSQDSQYLQEQQDMIGTAAAAAAATTKATSSAVPLKKTISEMGKANAAIDSKESTVESDDAKQQCERQRSSLNSSVLLKITTTFNSSSTAAASNAVTTDNATNEQQQPVQPGAYMGAPGTDLRRTQKIQASMLGGGAEADVDPGEEQERRNTVTIGYGSNDIIHELGDTAAGQQEDAKQQGLVVARSVMGTSTTQLAIEEEEHFSKVTTSKPKLLLSLAFCIIIIVAVVVLVVLIVQNKKDEESSNVSEVSTPEPVPTLGDQFLESLPASTKSILFSEKDPYAPQSLAYDWILNDPNWGNYSVLRSVQRFALATLFYSTHGKNWFQNGNWLSYNVSECDWYQKPVFARKDEMIAFLYPGYLTWYEPPLPEYGACNMNDNGDEPVLVNLWLDQNNLQGSIPPELYLLTSLQTLSLGLNGLEGPMFHGSSIGNLVHLEALAMYYHNTQGETIPTEIGLLTNLQELGLPNNQFHGSIPAQVFTQLTNLKTLMLGENPNLKGTIPTTDIAKFSNLKWLRLEKTDLNGTIPTLVGSLKSLQFLELGKNRLTGTLPTELGLLDNLKKITVHDNLLEGTLPSQLGELTNSTVLTFKDNPGLYGSIPADFGRLTNMAILNLQNSHFSGTLPTELGNLRRLEELSFLNNRNFCGTIPSQYGLLTEMRRFSVANNSLTGTIPTEMAGMLASGMLYSANFGGNELSGTVPSALCNSITADCIEIPTNPCEGVLGLTFDCSDKLCGCGDDACPCVGDA